MLNLDDLDMRIVREFNCPDSPQWKLRVSFNTIARRLEVDEETVRLRVRRLHAHGVIPTWRVAVNPRLLGYQELGLDLEVRDDASKTRLISRLRSVPGITQVADFRGPGLLAMLWHDRADPWGWLENQLDPLGALTLRSAWSSPFPEPTVRMRTVDWRILAALQVDSRRDLRALASELRTTVRTVQRRLSALTDGRAAFVAGTLNVARTAGLICNYLVHCPDVDRKRAADADARDSVPRVGTLDLDPEEYSILWVACENLFRAEELLSRLRSLYGVDTVRLAIVRKIYDVDEWLADQLRRRGGPVPGQP